MGLGRLEGGEAAVGIYCLREEEIKKYFTKLVVFKLELLTLFSSRFCVCIPNCIMAILFKQRHALILCTPSSIPVIKVLT